jgi:hypothetical protein
MNAERSKVNKKEQGSTPTLFPFSTFLEQFFKLAFGKVVVVVDMPVAVARFGLDAAFVADQQIAEFAQQPITFHRLADAKEW